MTRLEDHSTIIERKVCEANDRGEEVEDLVPHWQTRAEDLKIEIQELMQKSTDHENMQCGTHTCSNIKWRPPPPELEFWSTENYANMESRTPIFNDIVDALKDPNVNIVGVYGLGGVGKTTLVEEVGKQMQRDGTFKQVSLTTISKDLNVKEIQSQLADSLDFRFDAHSVDQKARATQLWHKINNGERYLVILDDLKCKVLPLAINAIGAALDGKQDHAWVNALDKLERFPLDSGEFWQISDYVIQSGYFPAIFQVIFPLLVGTTKGDSTIHAQPSFNEKVEDSRWTWLVLRKKITRYKVEVVQEAAASKDVEKKFYGMRFNMKTGLAPQKKLSISAVDFPRVNESYIGRKQQYVYGAMLDSMMKELGWLHVKDCGKLEGIVGEVDEDGLRNEASFSKLVVLGLSGLPNLVSFYTELGKVGTTDGNSTVHAQPLFNEKVAFPDLEKLIISTQLFFSDKDAFALLDYILVHEELNPFNNGTKEVPMELQRFPLALD
ncbi:hypothetical protein Vadar_006926 [Vaccinium darrowii]|uniref:Uncharacterized protein n=1 Tax=Vaccinium darrowii TaxID=229202 RepID=A0ACB7ZA26_9ERIC|nr:hypothetical protein Vadar_006926 [Vaccinium darrowii]